MGEPDLKPLQDAIDAWYSEARSVARARLALTAALPRRASALI